MSSILGHRLSLKDWRMCAGGTSMRLKVGGKTLQRETGCVIARILSVGSGMQPSRGNLTESDHSQRNMTEQRLLGKCFGSEESSPGLHLYQNRAHA